MRRGKGGHDNAGEVTSVPAQHAMGETCADDGQSWYILALIALHPMPLL